MREDIRFWLILRAIVEIGDIRFRYLIDRFGSPEAVLRASLSALSEVKGIDRKIAQGIIEQKRTLDPEKEIAVAKQHNVDIVTYLDPEYPSNLKTIFDYPSILYIQGKLVPEDAQAIAIIGSRRATTYGALTARKLAQDLVCAGVTVVSGFARGIDTEAHLGAIESHGRNIAVLGSGIDICYPRENKGLRDKIIQSGAIISEFPLGIPPDAPNFPRRNRIISGLSLGVVIVEASDKSGALLTAGHALDQNRLVFAVPGNVTAATSRGTNKLIQQGAKLVTEANDILVEIGLMVERKPDPAKLIPAYDGLPVEQKKIVEVLSAEPMHVDQISALTQLAPAQLAQYLLELELKGFIREVAGKRFVRII
ncbi:MAG: DNA-processing protein DprA [bacterium]|nr:DNA-processing protein DprA [bacterium]